MTTNMPTEMYDVYWAALDGTHTADLGSFDNPHKADAVAAAVSAAAEWKGVSPQSTRIKHIYGLSTETLRSFPTYYNRVIYAVQVVFNPALGPEQDLSVFQTRLLMIEHRIV